MTSGLAVATGTGLPDAEGAGVVVRATALSKSFGGVRAITGIDLEVAEGEVVGIMGPNGAGKSTLLSLLAGVQRPTSGELVVCGRPMRRADPALMARIGVGLAHQIPKPFRRLSVRDNVRIAAQVLPRARRRAVVEQALDWSGIAAKGEVRAGELGLLELKRLELARVLALEPRLVLLDEVAAGLTAAELDELIELVARIRDQGRTIVIVEHVQEVFHELAERIVVLEWGEKLCEGTPAEVSADPRVVEIYLGDGAEQAPAPARVPPPRGDPDAVLATRSLSAGYGPVTVLHEVSLEVRPGEVLAVLGANGAGKSTLAKSVAGMMRARGGSVLLDGEPIDRHSSFERVHGGIALVPEGRRLFGDLSVRENLEIGRTRRSGPEALERVHTLFPKLREIADRPASALSGGEQQMVAIGRALACEPRVVIFDELSLGLAPVVVDRLLEAVRDIADWGTAVILIEQNVHRALAMADRALVLRRGRVIFTGPPHEFSEEELRLAYLGIDEEPGRPLTHDSPTHQDHTVETKRSQVSP